MTDEQIELEFEHIDIDRRLKNGNKEQYEDDEYAEYDKETEDTDNKISYEYGSPQPSEAAKVVNPTSEGYDKGDWEDVETDIFDQDDY